MSFLSRSRCHRARHEAIRIDMAFGGLFPDRAHPRKHRRPRLSPSRGYPRARSYLGEPAAKPTQRYGAIKTAARNPPGPRRARSSRNGRNRSRPWIVGGTQAPHCVTAVPTTLVQERFPPRPPRRGAARSGAADCTPSTPARSADEAQAALRSVPLYAMAIEAPDGAVESVNTHTAFSEPTASGASKRSRVRATARNPSPLLQALDDRALPPSPRCGERAVRPRPHSRDSTPRHLIRESFETPPRTVARPSWADPKAQPRPSRSSQL